MMYSILCFILIPYITAESIGGDDDYWDWDKTNDQSNTTGGGSTGSGTPSPTCQTIVEDVGWAISNYTLCSVRNARPIHLCEKCVNDYLRVRAAHDIFEATIDEDGNICGDYFVNLDRLQIVSEAYKYVRHLWGKANCNSCFKRDINGTITKHPTAQTLKFDRYYKQTKACFKNHTGQLENLTCIDCLDNYSKLTDSYIDIQDSCGDAVCMDIVDTMNITRFMWSDRGCVRREGVPTPLKVGIGLMAFLPLTFYILAYFLANKQEAPILQQKRLAEVFAINSNSGNFGVTEIGSSSGEPRSSSAIRRHPPVPSSLQASEFPDLSTTSHLVTNVHCSLPCMVPYVTNCDTVQVRANFLA